MTVSGLRWRSRLSELDYPMHSPVPHGGVCRDSYCTSSLVLHI